MLPAFGLLLCFLVPLTGGLLGAEAPKFNHAFRLNWSPPYLEDLFAVFSLRCCLCRAPRRNTEGLINLPEYCMPRLISRVAAQAALTLLQCMDMRMDWERNNAEGQSRIWGKWFGLIVCLLGNDPLLKHLWKSKIAWKCHVLRVNKNWEKKM